MVGHPASQEASLGLSEATLQLRRAFVLYTERTVTLRGSVSHSSRLPRALAAFDAPGFHLLFMNGSMASVSMNVRNIVHGWLVLSITNGSPFWLGVAVAFLGIGQMVFSIVGGTIADRFQRRTILIIEQLVGAAVAWALAITTYFEIATLPLALSLAFVMGALRGVSWPATNTLIYDVVGPERLLNATGFWRIGITPMLIFGSLIVGALIEWAGIWAAYAFIGTASLLAPLFLVFLKVRNEVDSTTTSLLRRTAQGLRFAAGSEPVRNLFIMSVLMEALGFSFLTMLPVMAKNVLEAGPMGLGMLSAAAGFGSLVALIGITALGEFRRKSLLVLVNALGAGVALLVFAMSRSLLLSMVMSMFTMGFLMAYDLSLATLLQLLAPPSMRGRIVSLHSLAIGFMSLGGFVTGTIGSIVGVPLLLGASGVGIIVHGITRAPAILRIREPQSWASTVTTAQPNGDSLLRPEG